MGYRVDVAPDGLEALRLLRERRYAAVLMDCQMPEMDGYTTTRRIRSRAESGIDAEIPIIALTAYAMPSDRQKCIEAGMDDYVTKPLRAQELQRALLQCGLPVGSGWRATSEATGPEPAPDSKEAALAPAQIEELRQLQGIKYPTVLQDLVEMFLAQTPAMLDELRAAAQKNDLARINLIAHRLAGSCANLGATPMRAAAHALEQAADQAGAPVVWEELMRGLDREWLAVQSKLRELMETLNA
jgi:CheY-like chemotaxis protein